MRHRHAMQTILIAYATQFLIAVLAICELWSQVGGQSHLDLLPWHVKLVLVAGASFAVVKATAAAVSNEQAWNAGTLKWLGIVLVFVVGCGVASYYSHVNLEEQPDQQEQDAASSVGELKFVDHSLPFHLGLGGVHQQAQVQS